MEYNTCYNKILKQIIYQCREENHPVSEALVSYILNILYDENNDTFYFKSNHINSEDLHDEVIKKTMDLLNRKNDGEFEVLKLQIAYELAHLHEEEKLDKIKNYFDSEINKIINEITQYRNPSKKDYDSIQIHKKIFSCLLIKTRQNSLIDLDEFSSDPAANSLGISSEREIYAVLDGVLPKSGLPPFVSLSSQDKIAQLNNLSDIVLGIRLMNKEIEKGGIGLISLKDIKKRFQTNLYEELQVYYSHIMDTCEKYSAIYENVNINSVTETDELKILEKIRKLIIYYRQILSYLSILSDDVLNSSVQVDELCKNYQKEINFLNSIVEKKSPVSKEQAYPRFENLAKLYGKFQIQSFMLDIRENVFIKLQEFVKSGEISENFELEIFEGKFLFQEHLVKLDIYLNKPSPIFSYEQGFYKNGVTILHPNNTADFGDIKLEFKGFCIVTLLTCKGLLIDGKPDIVAKYKDKYLVFVDQSATNKFLENPDHYLHELTNYVKKNPFLINLLNMSEEFPHANLSYMFRDKENSNYKYKSSSVMVDKFMQTVVHVYEDGLIDPNYVWNEWELKKQAIQLADIMKKKTVSCQTVLSHYKRENETQVYPPKEIGVNTTVSKGTNLSIEKTYVSDVRKYDKNY